MKDDGAFARPLAWLKERAPAVHHFLTREDKPFPGVREALAVATFLVLMAAILWGATGVSFPSSPVVVVESESMMHCDPPFAAPGRACQRPGDVSFGRLGTIDPGDLIFVRDIDGRGDVQAWADSVDGAACGRHSDYSKLLDCRCDGRQGYGACGDVVIFRKSNANQPVPVIHRAIFWLEIHGDGTYSVDLPDGWGCEPLDRVPRSGLQSACLSRLGADNLHTHHALDGLGPEDSGFITRGDNNQYVDQEGSQIEPLPVPPSRMLGKARGELPWLGLLKLFVTGIFVGEGSHYQRAPGDLKALMWVSLAAIIGAPMAFEAVTKRRREG